MLQFWVYILHCSDGSFYTGHTDDLEKRFAQHEQGIGAEWTRTRRPVKLVWAETAPTRAAALAFELRLKRWSRAKKIALIEADWDALSYHAMKPRERPSFSLGTTGPANYIPDSVDYEIISSFVPPALSGDEGSENEWRLPRR